MAGRPVTQLRVAGRVVVVAPWPGRGSRSVAGRPAARPRDFFEPLYYQSFQRPVNFGGGIKGGTHGRGRATRDATPGRRPCRRCRSVAGSWFPLRGRPAGRPAARFFRATLLSKFSTPRELRWRDQGGDPRPWPDENRGQKSVVFYSRSAMGICYLHSGSDKQCKKCCNLHRIRDSVPPKRRQGTPP